MTTGYTPNVHNEVGVVTASVRLEDAPRHTLAYDSMRFSIRRF